jgi:hypothetical protein
MTGFIAQDLNNIFPDAVTTNGDDGIISLSQGQTPWMIDYSKLTPLIVKSIQEMELRVTGINDLDVDNIWRDSLVSWFGNATNGIRNLFVNQMHTKELCVSDDFGETCITRSQLDTLLSGFSTNDNSGGGSIFIPTDTDFCPNVIGTQIESEGACADTLCLSPDTWNAQNQTCDVSDQVQNPLICNFPQILNSTGDVCIDPTPEPLVCEAPKVLNTTGDACVDPAPIEPPSDLGSEEVTQ